MPCGQSHPLSMYCRHTSRSLMSVTNKCDTPRRHGTAIHTRYRYLRCHTAEPASDNGRSDRSGSRVCPTSTHVTAHTVTPTAMTIKSPYLDRRRENSSTLQLSITKAPRGRPINQVRTLRVHNDMITRRWRTDHPGLHALHNYCVRRPLFQNETKPIFGHAVTRLCRRRSALFSEGVLSSDQIAKYDTERF